MNKEKIEGITKWMIQLSLFVLVCPATVCAEVKDLKSSDLKQREAEANKIKKERQKMVSQLIELAKEDVKPIRKRTPNFPGVYPWHDSKHLAIMLVGEFRAIEAIPVLIENIEYINPKSIVSDEMISIVDYSPSAEALVKIGMPTIEPVIEKLGTYDRDCLGRQICAWIIKEVLGVKLGRYKLQLAIEETKDAKVKKNLQAVLPGFKTLQEQLNAERTRREKQKAKQK